MMGLCCMNLTVPHFQHNLHWCARAAAYLLILRQEAVHRNENIEFIRMSNSLHSVNDGVMR